MESYTEVFVWGSDHFGQLGLGGKKSGKTHPIPRFCSFNILIRSISCGEEHTAFVASNGSVYSMGNNSEGRLGIGDATLKSSASPCLVESLIGINAIQVSCGMGHTVVISDEGRAFSWGQGEYGALGIGNIENQWEPQQVVLPRSSRALQVSCGSRHTAFIIQDGLGNILMTCGAGEAGQLGTGRRERETVPVRINSEEPRQVSCGVFHTAYTTRNGRVYTMGGNSFGQLGTGSKKSSCHPMLVHSLDTFFIEKVTCGNHTAALTDSGSVFIWGSSSLGEFLTPHKISNIPSMKDVEIGGQFGCMIDITNRVWAWGNNSNGELGLGDYTPRSVPCLVEELRGKKVRTIACGGCYSVALGADVHSRSKSPMSKANTSFSMARDFDESYIAPKFEEPSRFRESLNGSRNRPMSRSELFPETENPRVRSPLRRARNSSVESSEQTSSTDIKIELNRLQSRYIAAQEERDREKEIRFKAERELIDEKRRSKELLEQLDKLKQLELEFNELRRNSEFKDRELRTLQAKSQILLGDKENTENEIERLRNTLVPKDIVADLESQLTEARRNLDYKDRELRTLQTRNQILTADKEKADLEIDRLRNNMVAKDIFEELEHKYNDARRNIELKDRENRSLQTKLSMYISDKQQADDEINRLRGNLIKNENEFQRMQEDFSIQVKALHEAKVQEERLMNQVNEMTAEEAKLRRSIEELRQNNWNLTMKEEMLGKEANDIRIFYEQERVRYESEMNNMREAWDNEKRQLIRRIETNEIKMKETETRSEEEKNALRASNYTLQQEKNASRIELEQEKTALRACRIEFEEEKNALRASIYTLQQEKNASRIELDQEKTALRACRIELEEEKNALRAARYEVEESRNLILNLQKEISVNQHSYNELSEEFNQLNNSYQSLANLKESIEQERNMLQDKFRRKEEEYVKISREKADIINELELSKRALEDQKYEIENLTRESHEHLNTIDRMTQLIDEWEHKYSSLLQEYHSVRRELSESELKNKELFNSLERELQSRAREYKERTLTMLNTPIIIRNPSTPKPGRLEASPFNQSTSPGIRVTDIDYPEPQSVGVSPMSRHQLSSANTEKLLNSAQSHLESNPPTSPLANMRTSSPTRQSTSKRPDARHVRSNSSKNLLSTPQDVLNEMRSRLMGLQKNKYRAD